MFELNSDGIKQDQNGLPASLQDQMVLAWQIFRTDIWNHCRFIINNLIALLCVYMIRQRVIIRQFMCCRLVPAPESHSRPWRPPITLNSSRVYVDWLVKWGVEPFCVQILLINSWLMKLLGGKKTIPILWALMRAPEFVYISVLTSVDRSWKTTNGAYRRWCSNMRIIKASFDQVWWDFCDELMGFQPVVKHAEEWLSLFHCVF